MLSNILPANRLIALTTALTALAAFVSGVVGVFPHAWQNTALVIAGLLTKAVTAITFMHGSQKFDALQAGAGVLPVDAAKIAQFGTETHVDVGNEPLYTKAEALDLSDSAALVTEQDVTDAEEAASQPPPIDASSVLVAKPEAARTPDPLAAPAPQSLIAPAV